MPKNTVVWLDIEDKCQQKLGRYLIDIINAYVDIINAEGYVCGLYTGMAFYKSYIKPYAKDMKIPLSASWIARYYNGYTEMKVTEKVNEKYKPFAPERIAGWQFTSSGVIKGIQGRVDCNVVYLYDAADNESVKPTVTTYEGYVNTSGGRLNVRNSKGAIVGKLENKTKVTVYSHADGKLQFTALSGRHSVLERPLSGENGRPFLVITPEIIGY